MTPRDGAIGPLRPGGDLGFGVGALYAFCHWLCRVAAITFFDFRAYGVHWLPSSGATIIASNHQSLLDPCTVGMIPDRRYCYLAKESLFRIPFLGWLIRQVGSFPIPRESVSARKALDTSIRLLETGRAMVMFPEGTRSPDGRLQPLKRGIGLIVRRSGAVVLPAVIAGSHAAWPKGALFPRPGRTRVTLSRPLEVQQGESSDSFVGRLSDACRALAARVGVPCAPDERAGCREGDGRGKEPLPSSARTGDEVPRAAGDDSWVACTTQHGSAEP